MVKNRKSALTQKNPHSAGTKKTAMKAVGGLMCDRIYYGMCVSISFLLWMTWFPEVVGIASGSMITVPFYLGGIEDTLLFIAFASGTMFLLLKVRPALFYFFEKTVEWLKKRWSR